MCTVHRKPHVFKLWSDLVKPMPNRANGSMVGTSSIHYQLIPLRDLHQPAEHTGSADRADIGTRDVRTCQRRRQARFNAATYDAILVKDGSELWLGELPMLAYENYQMDYRRHAQSSSPQRDYVPELRKWRERGDKRSLQLPTDRTSRHAPQSGEVQAAEFAR